MTAIAVDAYPYLDGDMLNVPIELNGTEVFVGEVDIRFLVQHFLECCVYFGVDQAEHAMYDLVFALEDCIDMINEVMGAD
jgi:hypothetical protein